MFAAIENVLTDEELQAVRQTLAEMTFVDGKATTSGVGADIKHNLQADRSADAEMMQALDQVIIQALSRNAQFEAMTQPRRIAAPLYARYEPGMTYGDHVDAAIMGKAGAQPMRADVSCTVFLSDPSDYDGGELVVNTPVGEFSETLPAGDAVIYPATTLHRVEPVTRGERLVAVIWIQSHVRDPELREILFDLRRVGSAIAQTAPESQEADLLSKTYNNLLRRFAEA